MKCLADGSNGDLFIMKPPACTIKTLVEALELHFGRKLVQRVIGIRAGEKMDEMLLTGNEVYRSVTETEGKIVYARIVAKQTDDYFLKGEDYVEPEPFSSANAERYDLIQVLAKEREAGMR